MPKHDTKRQKKKPAQHRKRKRPKEEWQEDPPALLTVSELAKLAGVTERTIQLAANEPDTPRRVGSKYPRDAWLRELQGRKIYRPRYWRAMTDDEKANAPITGNIVPAPIPLTGAPTPKEINPPKDPNPDDDASADLATTTTEMMRLDHPKLIKAKLAEEVITRRISNQERKRRLIPRAEVEECLFSRGQQVRSLERQIILELPPKLVGLDRAEIETRVREALQELFRRIAAVFDPIKPAVEKAEQSQLTAAAPQTLPDAQAATNPS